jgi:hypothetical protein
VSLTLSFYPSGDCFILCVLLKYKNITLRGTVQKPFKHDEALWLEKDAPNKQQAAINWPTTLQRVAARMAQSGGEHLTPTQSSGPQFRMLFCPVMGRSLLKCLDCRQLMSSESDFEEQNAQRKYSLPYSNTLFSIAQANETKSTSAYAA